MGFVVLVWDEHEPPDVIGAGVLEVRGPFPTKVAAEEWARGHWGTEVMELKGGD